MDIAATPTNYEQFRVVTPKELQGILRISQSHYFELLRDGKIRTIKVGGARRILIEEVKRLLAEGTN